MAHQSSNNQHVNTSIAIDNLINWIETCEQTPAVEFTTLPVSPDIIDTGVDTAHPFLVQDPMHNLTYADSIPIPPPPLFLDENRHQHKYNITGGDNSHKDDPHGHAQFKQERVSNLRYDHQQFDRRFLHVEHERRETGTPVQLRDSQRHTHTHSSSARSMQSTPETSSDDSSRDTTAGSPYYLNLPAADLTQMIAERVRATKTKKSRGGGESPASDTSEPEKVYYPCPWTECGKLFTRPSHLQKHLYIHTGERPHKCNHCQNAFKTKWTLTKHIRTHTGERPFECEDCHMKFTQRGSWQRHVVHYGANHSANHSGNHSATKKSRRRGPNARKSATATEVRASASTLRMFTFSPQQASAFSPTKHSWQESS